MRFGSLFAGIGGLDLGLERAGMECAWQVEIDDYCTRVLAKHWPDVPKYGDVRDVGEHNLEPVDLIAGGFPCQPHSVAGKRRGAEDDRNLWPEFIRIIEELEPRLVLAENVPGIVTTYLDKVLSDLEGAGYTCATLNLPACAFDAPHKRARIFIVAYATGRKDDERRPRNMGKTSASGESVNATIGDGSTNVPNPPSERLQRQRTQGEQITKAHGGQDVPLCNGGHRTIWTVEPNVGRVADGIPNRVDRLRGLGNAVVPQVAEWIGRRIIEHAATQ